MSAAPFIVALDGPSDTGKSTLAQCLCEALGPEVRVLPCYADLAGPEQPPARRKDAEEQLRGLEFYLALDRERQAMVAGADSRTIVVADRSWLGLLAHTYAIEQTGGPEVYRQARVLIDEQADELLMPDVFLYLALDAAGRRARAEETDSEAWFTNEALNEQIDRFFINEAADLLPGAVAKLDAAPAVPEVHGNARQIILEHRENRG
jgi:thymidylate kinase